MGEILFRVDARSLWRAADAVNVWVSHNHPNRGERRGVFHSAPDLIRTTDDYIATHNEKPKPFIWTANAKDILEKVIRANRNLSSKQNDALH